MKTNFILQASYNQKKLICCKYIKKRRNHEIQSDFEKKKSHKKGLHHGTWNILFKWITWVVKFLNSKWKLWMDISVLFQNRETFASEEKYLLIADEITSWIIFSHRKAVYLKFSISGVNRVDVQNQWYCKVALLWLITENFLLR